MSWNPIVVGIDGSPEAAWAAALGADIAETAGTTCHLVYATGKVAAAVPLAKPADSTEDLAAAQIAEARERVLHGLWGVVPTELLERVVIRVGDPAVVLKSVVRKVGAELVVLGGKHHSVIGRWLAGSTGVDVARRTDVPLLVTGSGRAPIRRVLVAVDVSTAAQHTIAAAERYASVFGAQLRVISVLEPPPPVPGAPSYHGAEYFNVLEERVIQHVWPLVKARDVEKFVRYGMPVDLIKQEAAAWEAGLVVVGSQGKDWVDRLLIGSVTERLLNNLPTSLLVVPTHAQIETYDPAPVDAKGTAQRRAFA